MNRKVNKLRIFSIVGIIVTLLTMLGFTYAYFSVEVFGNSNAKRTAFKNNPLTITYSNDTPNITSASSFTPGESISKTFSITNPTNETLSFSISLSDITNTFTRVSDIEYELILDGVTITSDTFPTSEKVITYSQIVESNETLNKSVSSSKSYCLG